MLRSRGPSVPVVSTVFDPPADAANDSKTAASKSTVGAGSNATRESERGAAVASWQAQVTQEGRVGFGNTTRTPPYGTNAGVEPLTDLRGNPKTRQLQQVTNARVASHVQFQMLVNFQVLVVIILSRSCYPHPA